MINNTNKPAILVTNDDSYKAKGIRKLVEFLKPIGDIVVVAPENPMSAMGHAITIKTPLRMRRRYITDGCVEYVCSGTPVDCIKMGMQFILKKKPDLVVSGINHGSNASVNIIYSGTMGAVLEACMLGVPAIGFSLLDYANNAEFEHVKTYILQIIEKVLSEGLDKGTCLNVNFPKYSDEQIKGIRVCRQADACYQELIETREDPHGTKYYWMQGAFICNDKAEDTDQYALENNYISLVPIQYDMTAYSKIQKIKDWNL
jgi:5'-nucleotidase